MDINPLAASIQNAIAPNRAVMFAPRSGPQAGQVDVAFSNVLSDTFNTVSSTDRQSQTSALETLVGQADDMSGVLIDAQKAELALNLALQIRNKIMDAYNEVMRMQV